MAEEAGLVGRGTSPTPDGIRVGMTRVSSLHQGQPPGKGKRRTGDLTTERKPDVTWGSPTSREGYGDGAAIVPKRLG